MLTNTSSPPPLLTQVVRKDFLGATHRTTSPARTLAHAQRFLPVMGITRIANVTGLDRIGIPVVVVCRPNSRSLSVSQGKGIDLDAAKASALMESIEAYHAERIVLPLLLGSYEELRYTYPLVDVAQLPRSADNLYYDQRQLLWVEGVELTHNRPLWVPYELVHTNYTLPRPSGSGCFNASSNGLASGNHLLEAVQHAICELIERDATTLWYLLDPEHQQATRLDLASIDDVYCLTALRKFRQADIEVGVWETTSDIGVPAFLCMICDGEAHEWKSLHAAAGMGCHPSRAIALLRALTEAAQSRLTVITGSRDDIFPDDFEKAQNPVFLQQHRQMIRAGQGERALAACPDFIGNTFNEDVLWLMDRLSQVGLDQVVVVDLSRPEFRIPVARVVIPGLESLSSVAGYQPGKRARNRSQAYIMDL